MMHAPFSNQIAISHYDKTFEQNVFVQQTGQYRTSAGQWLY